MHLDLPGFDAPVRPGKLLCIGRNYADHVKEMGDVAEPPSEPVVFLKPSTALVPTGGTIVLPRQSQDVHHEVELVVALQRGGKDIAQSDALGHVAGYALGIDVTARDLQKAAKDKRAAWSVAKGFDTFAPVGPFTPAAAIPDVQALRLALDVNGQVRQDGSTGQMIFSVAALVAYLSTVFTLEPGDLIFTGTPEGVGPIRDGDRLLASGTGLEPLELTARAQA